MNEFICRQAEEGRICQRKIIKNACFEYLVFFGLLKLGGANEREKTITEKNINKKEEF